MRRSKSFIMGVDLSKSSTGLSLFKVDDLTISYVDSCNISLDKIIESNYTKCYFRAKDMILDKIRGWVAQMGILHKLDPSNLSIALETPIFGAHTSELQFYLNQETLKYFYSRRYNVVGYSPMLLKKFAKLCSTVPYKGILTKKDMESVYRDSLLPLNGSLPKFEEGVTSDEIDAIFLGLIGSVMQSRYLLEIKDRLPLLQDGDVFSSVFTSEFDNTAYEGIKFSDTLEAGVQFKEVKKNLIKNSHLTLKCKTFYPFNETFNISKEVNKLLKSSKEEAFTLLSESTGVSIRRLKRFDKYKGDNSYWDILFNRKGEFTLE